MERGEKQGLTIEELRQELELFHNRIVQSVKLQLEARGAFYPSTQSVEPTSPVGPTDALGDALAAALPPGLAAPPMKKKKKRSVKGYLKSKWMTEGRRGGRSGDHDVEQDGEGYVQGFEASSEEDEPKDGAGLHGASEGLTRGVSEEPQEGGDLTCGYVGYRPLVLEKAHNVSKGFRKRAAQLVASNVFTIFVASMIIANAVTIGLQTDYMARHWATQSDQLPVQFRMMEKLFCVVFLLELVVRIGAFGVRGFFCSSMWNWFDFSMVAMQVTEQLEDILGDSSAGGKMSVFRIVRLVRIIRLARMLHIVNELRMLVVSITSSIKSLGWVMLLLLMLMYVFAVYLVQMVTDFKVLNLPPPTHVEAERHAHYRALGEAAEAGESEEDGHVKELLHFYGNLPRAVFSLYMMVSDGIHWGELEEPLSEHVSPHIRFVFFAFTAFAIFAVLNVITAIFVESAMATATEDSKATLTSQLRGVFQLQPHGKHTEVSLDDFKREQNTPELQHFMKEIDVHCEDAEELFALLDMDGSGKVDSEEFIHGTTRLMGHARAIDLALFMHEWNKHTAYMERLLHANLNAVTSVRRSTSSADSGQEMSNTSWALDNDTDPPSSRQFGR